MLQDDNTASQTYELFGPTNYSMAQIAELVDREIIKKRRHINVPKRLLKPMAKLLNDYIFWPTTSADQVEREYIDQKIDPKAKTFKDLGMDPAELSSLTFLYLVSLPYRFVQLLIFPQSEMSKKREKHVTNDIAPVRLYHV